MHHFKRLSTLSLLLTFLFSCSKPLPDLAGIDSKLWKEDRRGCSGARTKMITAITIEMEKLKSLSEMDIAELLGRPDESQLLDRNQKFYIYYLEPSPWCDRPTANPKKLILRINAMGLAKETMIK